MLLFFGNTAFCQDIQVKGKIISKDDSKPLPDVSVTIRGSSARGTVSDNEGNFAISAPGNAVLVISRVGYSPLTIPLNGRTMISVGLSSNSKQLDDLIVIGYGTQKKSDLTGSVAQIKTKTFDESAYSNFQQALAGKVSGVVVNETSGQPGAGLSVEIRGASSINFSTQPLYVVDGIPLDDVNTSALSNNANAVGAYASSPLAALNPNDIASIEVLKDASATAIYGSRGANGVVLVTTKSGSAGKAKVSLNYSHGFSQMLKYMDMLDKNDYVALATESYYYRNPVPPAGGYIPPYLDSEIPGLGNYDHQKEITRTAQTKDLNMSVSGGDQKSKYYLSGQYFDQEGLLLSSKLKRANFKINYENNLNTRLKLGVNLNISRTLSSGSVINSFAGGMLNSALIYAPTVPFTNSDGSYNIIRNYYYGSQLITDPSLGKVYYNSRFPYATVTTNINPGSFNNPLAYARDVINDNTSLQMLGNLNLGYKITDDLTLNGLLGVTTYNSLLQYYLPTTVPVSGTLKGVASLGNLQSTKMLYQATLNYDKKINRHNINAVLGGTAEKYVEKSQTSSSQSFATDVSGPNAIQAGQVIQVPTSDYQGYQLVSTLFRGSYNYDSRYYVTLSARYDGSSKFAENKRFGFFPSAGISWRMSNEKWFEAIRPVVSEFKLRASYGVIGNQALGPYNTLSTLSSTNAVFGGTMNAGYSPSRIPNPDLSWEQSKQTNVGIDLGLANDRIFLTVDAYRKTTSNLLFNINLPATSGFTSTIRNVAEIQNDGLEFLLSTVNVKTRDFRWTTDFNIAFNRNKVVSLQGNPGDYLGVNLLIGSAYLSRLTPGESIGKFYGYQTLPTWNDSTIKLKPAKFQPGAKEGDRRYKDINGDGLLTDADRTFIGSSMPKFTGGFNTSFAYKNFELSAFFSFSYGNDVFNQLGWTLENLGGFNNALKKTYNDRYRPITSSTDPGKAADMKEFNYQTKTAAAGALFDLREVTDYYVEDGSYFRCKDINLTYNFPARIVQKLKLSRTSIYLNLQNLFTITRYSGYNPEVNTGSLATRGLDNGTYPIARTCRVGINIGF